MQHNAWMLGTVAEPMTDDDWRRADIETRQWWARVYQLKMTANCSLAEAIAAVKLTDKEHNAR